MGPSLDRSAFFRAVFRASRRRLLLVALGAWLPVLGACRDSGPTAVTPPSNGPQISSLIASPASLNL